MGRHSHDDASVTGDWEDPPPVAPLWRARVVTSAVLLLAVVAAAWWAVSWLTSPAGPAGVPAPQAASLDAQQGEPGKPGGGGGVDAGQGGGQHGGEEQAGPRESRPGGPGPDQTSPGRAAEGQQAGIPAAASGAVIVHVAGEVHEPGLVELPAGSRVADALRAAGGSTTRAELDLLNLAAPAVDASQILVPGPDTPRAAEGTGPGPSPGPAGPGGPGAAGGSAPTGGTVNVNTADAATLEQLPGIGPALAGRIVEHREQVGPYGSMEDLDAVSGIGPAMMERLEGLVGW
ncbi:MAG: ComEA family DNA-binding protein [Micrococcus sp.]|nr:ComEA family DNA-binding protein [Micrococcus sp.]